MFNFGEVRLFDERFSHKAVSVLRQKGALCLKQANRTRLGLLALVLLGSEVFLCIVFFCSIREMAHSLFFYVFCVCGLH